MKKLFLLSFVICTCNIYGQITDYSSANNFYDLVKDYYSSPAALLPDSLKGATNKEFERNFRIWVPRLYPAGDFSVASNAMHFYFNSFTNGTGSACSNNYENQIWDELGPDRLQDGSASYHKGVGRIQRIEFDPNYNGTSNTTIYGSSEVSGLWKTTDDGLNWDVLNTDYQLPISSVSDVTIDHNNTSNIFISTGMADVQLNSNIEANTNKLNPIWTAGIYRSTNGGTDWNPINNGLLSYFTDGGSIRNIIIDPINSDKLYAATSEGFFYTTNALAASPTWTNIPNGFNNDAQLRGLEFKPGNSNIIYTSGTDVYRSLNSGLTWQSITTPSYPGLDINGISQSDNFSIERINVAVTPDNPEALFAYIVGQYDYLYGSTTYKMPRAYIYKFTGTEWLEFEEFTPLVSINSNNKPQASAIQVVGITWLGIAVSPIDENLVIYGSTIIKGRRSTGAFVDITDYYGAGFHPDVHDLKFTPEGVNPRIFAATHGGVNEGVIDYTQTLSLSYTTWFHKSNGLRTSTLWTFDLSKRSEAYVIGHQDNGTSFIENGLMNWKKIGEGDGFTAAISNYSNPKGFFNMLRIFPILPFVNTNASVPTPMSLEYPTSETYIPKTFPNFSINKTGKDYFVFSEIYEKLADDGGLWDNVWSYASDVGHIPIFNTPGTTGNHVWRHQLSEVAVSQVDPNIVYVAVGGSDLGVDFEDVSDVRPFLLKSETGLWSGTPDPNNQKFFDISGNLPVISQALGVPPCITGLAVDPENPNKVWVTFTGFYADKKVWKSDDGGQTWVNDDPDGSLANLPVNGIVIQDGTRIGNSDHRIFIATDAGVYYKEPGQTCWAKYGMIPNVRVTELKTITCDNTIHAATWGRGLWKTEMPPRTRPLATIEITENTTWDDPRFFEQNLKVKTGITLIIKDAVYMPESAVIIVEAGGALIVDGGTITSSCDKFWGGIQVWGVWNENQYSTGGQYHQGRAIFKNNAFIENAECAVMNMKPNDWGKVGGIIQARNTTFQNNRRSLQFLSYQNFYYVGGVYEKRPDRSFFRDCNFINDDSHLIPNSVYPPLNMVTMYKVNGITFTSCNFENTMTAQNSEQRKKAIASLDANYTVTGKCNSIVPLGQPCPDYTPSTFSGFNVGIHASAGSANSGPVVRHSFFEKNMVGIHFDAVDYSTAIFNEFSIGDHEFDSQFPNIDDAAFHTGIIAYENSFYTIEENELKQANNPHAQFTHGVLVSETGGESNELYKNTVEDLTSGSIAQGNNATNDRVYGLRFLCNYNLDNKQDFEVRKDLAGQYSYISSFQSGDFQYNSAAGNRFSAGDGLNSNYVHFDIYSNQHINYLFDDNIYSQTPIADEAFVSNNTIDLDNDGQPNTCPSHFTPIGVIHTQEKKATFTTGKSEYYNLLYSYHQLIDDGNTEAILSDIALTWPNDAWTLRDELIARSPYLSETVLISAADKNVLPSGMLLEVLMANPDGLRSGNVIAHVACCITNPLPTYMLDILKSAQDVTTARTLTEKALSSIHLNMTRDYKYIVNNYLNDSLGVNSDTTLVWLNEMKTIGGRYSLCTEYLDRGEFILAKNVLDSIGFKFKLSTNQLTELSEMRDYVDFINAIYSNGRNLAQLDSTEIGFLITMSNVPFGGIASERAENILCFFHNICKDPNPAPKSAATPQKKPKPQLVELVSAQNLVKTLPNPADEYMQLEISLLFSKENTFLNVYDIEGRKVESRKIGDVNDTVIVLDTRELTVGVYILEIIQENKQIFTDKFVIQR